MVEIISYRVTPGPLTPTTTTPVTVEITLGPTSAAITFEPMSGSPKVAMTPLGQGRYTTQIAASWALNGFDPATCAHRNAIGRVRVPQPDGTVSIATIVADILTPDIVQTPITALGPDAQETERVVNLISPQLYDVLGLEEPTAAQLLAAYRAVGNQFYQRYGDDYDILNIVSATPFFQNRGYGAIRLAAQGIGPPPMNSDPSQWGSAGRLMGYIAFPNTTLFDGGDEAFQHEIGHSAANHLTHPLLKTPNNHYPYGNTASCLMGAAGQAGTVWPFKLVPDGANYKLESNLTDHAYCDLTLYLMGLLPASETSDTLVFKDQAQTFAIGPVPASALHKISIGEIVAVQGTRDPPAGKAQRCFRMATILVSRESLVSQQMMWFYDHFAKRAEAVVAQKTNSGIVKQTVLPFFKSTRELGRLRMHLRRKVLFDLANPQGRPGALHQHLVSLGYRVDILSSGAVIEARHFANYDLIVRLIGRDGGYSQADIDIYRDYVWKGGGLVLIANAGAQDLLASAFGIVLQGRTRGGAGQVSAFSPHEITDQAQAFNYGEGAGVVLQPAENFEALGRTAFPNWLDINDDGAKGPGEPYAPLVLGAMRYGKGRVVVCGGPTALDAVSQPFTRNMLRWLTTT